MKLEKLITVKGFVFLLIFSALVLIGDQINFSKLIGAENQFFTLFQFFGPVAGYFLGPVVGVLSVLIAEIGSFFLSDKTFEPVNLLRLLPMLFAAWYFGTKKDKISILIPAAAIFLFILHPVGRQAWVYSLFWTIPIIIKLLPARIGQRIFLRSLGATFTAHSVGGIIWCYSVKTMTPAAWMALIPLVIVERLLFASGISISFLVLNYVLDKLDDKVTTGYLNIDKKYTPAPA